MAQAQFTFKSIVVAATGATKNAPANLHHTWWGWVNHEVLHIVSRSGARKQDFWVFSLVEHSERDIFFKNTTATADVWTVKSAAQEKDPLRRVLRELRLSQKIIHLHPEGEKVEFSGTAANVWCHVRNARTQKFVSSTGQPVVKGKYRPPETNMSHYHEEDWSTSQSTGWAVVLGAVTDGDSRVYNSIFSIHVWGKNPNVPVIEKVLYEHLFYTGANRETVSLDSEEKKMRGSPPN